MQVIFAVVHGQPVLDPSQAELALRYAVRHATDDRAEVRVALLKVS